MFIGKFFEDCFSWKNAAGEDEVANEVACVGVFFKDGFVDGDCLNDGDAVLVEAIKEQQVFIDDMDKELEIIKSKLT